MPSPDSSRSPLAWYASQTLEVPLRSMDESAICAVPASGAIDSIGDGCGEMPVLKQLWPSTFGARPQPVTVRCLRSGRRALFGLQQVPGPRRVDRDARTHGCLLYTSDAADE